MSSVAAMPITSTLAMPMIEARAVTKAFRARARAGESDLLTVLDRVSFSAGSGEFVSLLGASGCGKTTLLRIIAGLVQADAGEITVGGKPVRAPRRDLCMVFQNFGLLPWRTVVDNVAFPLELDGLSRQERETVAREHIALVGLAGFERHYPHELSGGMQQRVGIARALVRRPLVLLMDEPFAALDAQTREALQEDFLNIAKRLSTTVVFVTHSIDEALVMSDRILILGSRPGRLRQTFDCDPLQASGDDRRAHPRFSHFRQEIRQILRGEDAR